MIIIEHITHILNKLREKISSCEKILLAVCESNNHSAFLGLISEVLLYPLFLPLLKKQGQNYIYEIVLYILVDTCMIFLLCPKNIHKTHIQTKIVSNSDMHTKCNSTKSFRFVKRIQVADIYVWYRWAVVRGW